MSTFTSPIKAKDDHKIKSFKMKSAVIIIHYTVWFFFEKKICILQIIVILHVKTK